MTRLVKVREFAERHLKIIQITCQGKLCGKEPKVKWPLHLDVLEQASDNILFHTSKEFYYYSNNVDIIMSQIKVHSLKL